MSVFRCDVRIDIRALSAEEAFAALDEILSDRAVDEWAADTMLNLATGEEEELSTLTTTVDA